MSNLKDNVTKIRLEIAAALKAAGRTDDVLLVGVTKTFPVSAIEESISCNILDVGENKAQEFLEKYDIIKNRVNWHFIGHLQKNKVKYIAGRVSLIHSVDSFSLAEEISKRALQRETVQKILLEVNISQEESKFGLHPGEVEPLLRQCSTLEGIQVRGLMTMAPNVENDVEIREVFRRLKELSLDLSNLDIPGIKLDYLSMGMSQDYKLAILEGANIIRVGSILYGKR